MNKFKEKFDNIYEHILEARKEAQKRYIEANTILINQGIAYTNNLFIQDNDIITEYPPMIFGMKVFYDNNLPNNANFILTKTPKNKMEQINALEQELGIDLITLFKAKKEGIYYKAINHNIYYISKNSLCLEFNYEWELWVENHSILEGLLIHLKDYGTNWSLRKEDLENE